MSDMFSDSFLSQKPDEWFPPTKKKLLYDA